MQHQFPRLQAEGFKPTSPATVEYNCIAWAAGDASKFWWPDEFGLLHWPEKIAREETIGAMQELFESLDYAKCDDDSLEPEFEKVAIFALLGLPTHAARQLANGDWTSKLGESIDISHTLRGLGGGIYGDPVLFLKRKRQP